MFRNFLKNKKAQNTAEYALLIALVVAGIIAMQQYAQRALQARVRDASLYLTSQTGSNQGNAVLGNTAQYEPYYLQSNYQVQRNSADNKYLAPGLVAQQSGDQRVRQGFQESTYSNGVTAGSNEAMPSGI